jgi:hypothetical protein
MLRGEEDKASKFCENFCVFPSNYVCEPNKKLAQVLDSKFFVDRFGTALSQSPIYHIQ